MNTLNYKGYTAKIEFDPEDNILLGNIIGIRDTVGFHSASISELKEAFHEAVDFYLESCEKAGREPNKPFSGKFVVRVDSSLHGEIAAAVVHAGKSLNKWVADMLEPLSTAQYPVMDYDGAQDIRVAPDRERRSHAGDWKMFDKAADFLRERVGGGRGSESDNNKPFFLCLNPGLVHAELPPNHELQ